MTQAQLCNKLKLLKFWIRRQMYKYWSKKKPKAREGPLFCYSPELPHLCWILSKGSSSDSAYQPEELLLQGQIITEKPVELENVNALMVLSALSGTKWCLRSCEGSRWEKKRMWWWKDNEVDVSGKAGGTKLSRIGVKSNSFTERQRQKRRERQRERERETAG